MTEFEQQLLQHLQSQAEQLAALSVAQQQTSATLLSLSEQQTAILEALQREPSGESLEATLTTALQPLNETMQLLVTSFNKLLTGSEMLSEQLQQPK